MFHICNEETISTAGSGCLKSNVCGSLFNYQHYFGLHQTSKQCPPGQKEHDTSWATFSTDLPTLSPQDVTKNILNHMFQFYNVMCKCLSLLVKCQSELLRELMVFVLCCAVKSCTRQPQKIHGVHAHKRFMRQRSQGYCTCNSRLFWFEAVFGSMAWLQSNFQLFNIDMLPTDLVVAK